MTHGSTGQPLPFVVNAWPRFKVGKWVDASGIPCDPIIVCVYVPIGARRLGANRTREDMRIETELHRSMVLLGFQSKTRVGVE